MKGPFRYLDRSPEAVRPVRTRYHAGYIAYPQALGAQRGRLGSELGLPKKKGGEAEASPPLVSNLPKEAWLS